MRSLLAFFGAASLVLAAVSCGSSTPNPDDDASPVGGSTSSGGRPGSGGAATGGAHGNGCQAGQGVCNAMCVDILSDNNNCGGCNKQCGQGQTCSAGACVCSGGLKACGSVCVNTATDGANCGMCGTACTGGLVCSAGVCSGSCMAGEMVCDGNSCANIATDPTHCGSCTNKCQGGQSCAGGSCVCPGGQTTCNGVCTDTMTSVTNCGGCNVACTPGQTCSAGHCTGGSGAGGMGNTGGQSSVGGSAGMSTGGSAGMSTGGSAGTGSMVTRGACTVTKPGLISDFEEGTAAPPAVIVQEGRTGGWETFNDATSGATETMTVESSGGTAVCDQFALHVKGSGFTTWGAGVGFSLVGMPKTPAPYNAQMQGFTGISFKAKLGSGADAKSPVRFNISTPWTEDKSNPGGQCDSTTLAATTTKAKRDCYQHVGKFLPPGAGANQLTSSWQTYTFCFDRDLYPLSLPSNLTTDQRNSIATNMLKVQWQFNNGKDYSGAYTTDYPKFQPQLAFDFWVDDVSFFTGDCPNKVTSPSNGSPAKAFPQSSPMVGSCPVATNASKYAANIAQIYATWTKNFVQNDHIVAPEQNGDITSEAMGYGMLIAAAMGDKTAFDKFWTYAQNNGAKTGLMNWKNGGSGSATDADLDQAYALLMAAGQWSSGGYDGNSLGGRIATSDVSGGILTGGSQFSSANYNPSYFAPAAMRKLSALSGFVNQNYTLVNNNIKASVAGVPTDWADKSSGAPSGPGGAQVTSDIQDGNNGAMGYDAARVPFRLALDACLNNGDTSGLSAVVSYFAGKYDMGASIDLMKAGWYKKMDGVFSTSKDMQGSFIGPMGAAAMAMKNQVMLDRAFRTMLDILESGDFNHTYFPSTVGLLTLLMMSGNYPAP